LRALRRRNDRGAGFVDGESDEGGFDEFREFWPHRAVNSATYASNCAIRSSLRCDQSGKLLIVQTRDRAQKMIKESEL
jgi:hypothetical protein